MEFLGAKDTQDAEGLARRVECNFPSSVPPEGHVRNLVNCVNKTLLEPPLFSVSNGHDTPPS